MRPLAPSDLVRALIAPVAAFLLSLATPAIAEIHCTACESIPDCKPICWEFESTPQGFDRELDTVAPANPLHEAKGLWKASLRRKPLAAHPKLQALIHQIAIAGRVDPALVEAVVRAESGFDPFAVSHRGAQGLMQLMPKTARSVGVKNSFSAQENLRGGVTYLRQMLDLFEGDTRLALAAYNAGPSTVLEYRDVPPYKETRGYVERVFRFREQIRARR
jgi:soluble lytic murein transglycosylase-like protein